MRVVLDTNILISALLVQTGSPAAIYRAWQEGYFTLLTCAEHLDELRATLQKPRIAERIKPYKAGRLVNEIKDLAEVICPLPRVECSPDPDDDYLLALSEAGNADYLARPLQGHADHFPEGLRRVVRMTRSFIPLKWNKRRSGHALYWTSKINRAKHKSNHRVGAPLYSKPNVQPC